MMKCKPEVTKEEFGKLLGKYIRQMSKACRVPKQVENQLLHQLSSKPDSIEAFDGASMRTNLQLLQHEWEEILN